MDTFINWFLAHWVVYGSIIGVLVLNLVLARKSQIDSWCETNPRVAGLLKTMRALGLDPWMLVQGVLLFLTGKLPASYTRLAYPAATTTGPKTLADASKTSLLVLIILGVTGCTISLESAKQQGLQQRAQAVRLNQPVKAVSPGECDGLDVAQRYWGYAGYATGPVAPLAGGIAVIPGIGDKPRDAMLITAGVAGLATVFEFSEQKNFTNQWVQQGCGQ